MLERRHTHRQGRLRVIRKADRSHECAFEREIKGVTACSVPCSKDRWSKRERKGGSEENE